MDSAKRVGVYLFAAATAVGVAKAANEEWPTFREADNDRNGAISIDEVRRVPILADNFAWYDRNGDGKLSRAEYEAAKRAADTTDGAGKATGTGAYR